MNKTFKTLFTLFLGVLFFISTFTANSANIADDLTKLNNLYKEGAITKEEFSKAKDMLFKSESTEEKTETKKSEIKKKEKKEVKKSETKKKEKVKAEDKKSKDKKEAKIRTFEEDLTETYITLDEANALGTFKKIEKVPDGMFKETQKTFKGRAKRQYCQALVQYPAMMVPAMQGELIDAVLESDLNVKSIIDPFVGPSIGHSIPFPGLGPTFADVPNVVAIQEQIGNPPVTPVVAEWPTHLVPEWNSEEE